MESKNQCKSSLEDKNRTPEIKKMSYEDLEGISHQLSEQSRKLYMQNAQLEKALQESNLAGLYKRLDYLWQVIHSTTPYITEEFKNKCGAEFMSLMFDPEEETEQKKDE